MLLGVEGRPRSGGDPAWREEPEREGQAPPAGNGSRRPEGEALQECGRTALEHSTCPRAWTLP